MNEEKNAAQTKPDAGVQSTQEAFCLTCDCVERMEALYAAHGADLIIDPDMTASLTELGIKYRIGARVWSKEHGKARRPVLTLFCPFCGKKYE